MRRVCTSSAGPISGTWWSASARTVHRSRGQRRHRGQQVAVEPPLVDAEPAGDTAVHECGQVVALEVGIERFEVGLE